MRHVFDRLLKYLAESYSGRTGRNGMPYILHPLAVMAAADLLPEKIVALAHDFGEFEDVDKLAELGVPPPLLDRIRVLTKTFPDDVPENDPRYCGCVWDLLGDPVCRRIKYQDLLTNDGFEESPAKNGRRVTGRYLRVMKLLGEAVSTGKLFFYSRSLYVDIFSNFFPEPLEIGGLRWESGEHYYQAAKFAEGSPAADPAVFEAIRAAAKPGEAKLLADARLKTAPPLPPEYRIQIMESMLRIKFAPGTQMLRRLLQTGDLELVHETRDDLLWGRTRSGEGENLLGQLLMRIRGENRRRQPE